jgi:hypothetical protein
VAATRKPRQLKAGVRGKAPTDNLTKTTSRSVKLSRKVALAAIEPTPPVLVEDEAPQQLGAVKAAALTVGDVVSGASDATVTQADMADSVPFPAFGKPAEAKGEVNMTDMLESAKTYAEEAKSRMQSAFTEMTDKTKAAVEKSTKAFEELGDLTRGNLEAVVESSRIAAKAVESIGQETAEFSRQSFEKSSATLKSFASVKSPVEFFQLQSELFSQMIDGLASQTAKNSEKMLKLAGEVSQPISNRVSVMSEKIKSLAV